MKFGFCDLQNYSASQFFKDKSPYLLGYSDMIFVLFVSEIKVYCDF